METYGDLEVVWIAIAASMLLDGSYLGVQSFGDSVGDAMSFAVLGLLRHERRVR